MKAGNTMNNKRSAEIADGYQSKSVIEVFAPCIALEVLFSEKNIQSLRNFCSASGNNNSNVLNGFKLACVIVLDDYVLSVVNNSGVLGIKMDDDYSDYINFTQGHGPSIIRGSTRPDHAISMLREKAYSLLFRIKGTSDWAYMEERKNEIANFVENLENILRTCYTAKDKEHNEIDVENALKIDAIDHIVEYTDIMPMFHTYTNYYRDSDYIPDYDEVFDEFKQYNTRFDGLSLPSTSLPEEMPDSLALGFSLTIQQILQQLVKDQKATKHLNNLNDQVINIENWTDFEKYSSQLIEIFRFPPFFGRYTYKQKTIPSPDLLKSISKEPKERISSERILSRVGNRARIVESYSLATPINFKRLLKGLVADSRKSGEKTRVAIFEHEEKYDRRKKDYSFGILMPAYGNFSNYSSWWIFYDVANNHSGTASGIYKQIMKEIDRYIKYIDINTYVAEKEEFYKYCEDPGYLRLDATARAVNQMVTNIRGTYPELLISNMLSNMNYTDIKLRLEPPFLHNIVHIKGDLDVVGKRKRDDYTEIVIFESKGGACLDEELHEEVKRFSNTIQIISDNKGKFMAESYGLDNSADKIKIKAYFVSMGKGYRYDEFSNITFWNFDDFRNELVKHGMPEIYLTLLKEMPVFTCM